jgi:hypothetical protein
MDLHIISEILGKLLGTTGLDGHPYIPDLGVLRGSRKPRNQGQEIYKRDN